MRVIPTHRTGCGESNRCRDLDPSSPLHLALLYTFETQPVETYLSVHQTDNMAPSAFRQYLPDLNQPRFQISKTQSPYEYVEAFQRNQAPPWIYNLTRAWESLLEEPYKGVTSDGMSVQSLDVFPHLTLPQAPSARDCFRKKMEESTSKASALQQTKSSHL